MDLPDVQSMLGDRFTLVAEIGRGAMSVVYRADDHRHDRRVAVKVLKPELVDSSSAERFLREIRIEGRLQHPHILPIYESGTAGRYLYYVMPLVEGESLRERVAREGALPVPDALRIAREVADALACAHAEGLIHRDVKPANILLSGGHAMLADFGIARAVAESAGDSLTSSGVVVGTPAYMSPEQSGPGQEIDGRSDIYSLGCVLYEMLAGEPPFTARTVAGVFSKHFAEPPPSLDVLRHGLPPEVTDTVTRMLAKVPADRPADAHALLAELDQAVLLTTGTQRIVVRPRRFGWEWAAAAALVAVIGVAGWLVLRPETVPLEDDRVVIFPPASRTGANPDGGGVDLLISLAFDQIETLPWLSGWDWLTPEQRVDPRSVSDADYRRIAREMGAGRYLTGQVLETTEDVTVQLTLNATARTHDPIQSTASGRLGVTSLNDVMLDALRDLLPQIVDPGRDVDLTVITDRPPAAIASWVAGERSYRLSRFDEALGHYRRALEQDSSFTFAALKGARAASWSHQPAQARDLIDRAARTGGELIERHRLFLDGLEAFANGEADTALDRLRGALALDPRWSEAWMLMGEVHEHLLPTNASADSAAAFFRRAAADPGFTPPLIHLAEHIIRAGDVNESRELISRLATSGASREMLDELVTMATCVEDGPDGVAFPERARTTPLLVYQIAANLSAGALQTGCAGAAFEALLTADAWSSFNSWGAARGLLGLHLARADADGAARFIDGIAESRRLAPGNAVLGSAASASLFFGVMGAVAGLDMPSVTDRFEEIAHQRYGENYEDLRGVFTPWLLGNWVAARGDLDRVVQFRDHLLAAASGDGSGQATVLAAGMNARVQLMVDHDTAAAIATLERLMVTPMPADSVQNSLSAPLPAERLMLARLHLARGSFARALAVAAVFDHPGAPVFLPFIPESLRVRRDAALAVGDAALADRYTRRLRALGQVDR